MPPPPLPPSDDSLGETVASPHDARSPSSHPSKTTASARFEAGTRLGARYRVVGLLGTGGMGEVYRADDLELNQSVALKFLPERLSRNPAELARLRGEVRTARQIAHPNVCRTYDIAEADGHVFMVMEYVDGEDLASVLRRLGRPSPDKALEIARQLCLGLGAAHENGVLHRDLKPANIMIDGRGRVRITDFGLAGTAEEIAAEGGFAGTPAYMAPEQRRSGGASVQSDIFSLGLVLYEIFTGKRAADMSAPADPSRPGESSVRTPSSLVGSFDPVLERVILRCLENDPAQRPQSVYAVYGALPGGDPLAAAVAAGETPSPELVANAGVEGGMPPLMAGLAVLVAILSFIGVSAIQTPLFRGLGKSPSVLSVRAEEIVTRLTGRPAPRYSAEGLRYSPPARDTNSPADSLRAAGQKPKMKPVGGKQYWRRWSPSEFVTEDLHQVRPVLNDPPQAYPGSGIALLDMEGRLLALESLPPSGRDSLAARTANWPAVLAAAGRDPARAVAIPPPPAFDAHGDTVAAWRVSGPASVETTLVAAATAGHIVRVETFAGQTALGQLAVKADDWKPGVQNWIGMMFFLIGPLAGSIFLAVRNVRARRGDLRGALVVGISIVVYYLLSHLFSTRVTETGLFQVLSDLTHAMPLGHALIHGVTMALAYLAIEPYVRRLWPSVLVSWARLVAGRLRDPILGRDVLVGIAFGGAVQVLTLGVQILERFLGLSTDPARLSSDMLGTMTSAPLILSQVCFATAIGFLRATTLFTMLVIFRFLFRNNRLAGIATVLFLVLSEIDFSSKALWLALPAGLVIWTATLFLALRFGYVATIVAVTFLTLADSLSWSLDFNSWTAPQTMFAWGIVLVLLAYGLMTAVGGRSLFSDPLSDPVVPGRQRAR